MCLFPSRAEINPADANFTRGIFQSIGLKEFHSYLSLSPQQQKTDKGQQEFEKGVQLLKIATRQYARSDQTLK